MEKGANRIVVICAVVLFLVLLLFAQDCTARTRRKFGCVLPKEPLYGRFKFNKRTREITYLCDEDYILVGMDGETSRTCQAWMTTSKKVVRKWSGKHGDCIKLRTRSRLCPMLKNPRNGAVTISSREVGGEAFYTCEPGYHIEGTAKVTCAPGRKWSGQIPTCAGAKTAQEFARHLEDKFIAPLKASTSNSESEAQGKLSAGKSGLDIVFAVDVSSSIGPKSLETAKKFMNMIVDTFGVSNETTGGKNGTRIALITFAANASLVFNLNDREARTPAAVKAKINGIQHSGGGTSFVGALTSIMSKVHTRVIVLEHALGKTKRLEGATRAIFFITDSEETVDSVDKAGRLKARASGLRGSGFEIFVIGVGSNIDRNVLTQIASEPYTEHVFLLSSFKDLEAVTNIIAEKDIDYGQCGISGNTEIAADRTRAKQGAWPWLGWVSVPIKKNARTCGGVLLCERWFMTLAQCVTTNNETGHPIRVSRKKMDVFLGDHRLYQRDNSEAMVKPKRVLVHPKYTGTPNQISIRPYDIALLDFGKQKKKRKQLNKYVRPICFPSNGSVVYENSETILKVYKESTDASNAGFVAGWGHTGLSNQRMVYPWGHLKQTQRNIQPDSKCKKRYGSVDTDMIFCVGTEDEKDVCRGDIGGPYMAKMAMHQYTVLGLALDTTKCTKRNKFSIFLNLLHPEISEWVSSKLGKCNRLKRFSSEVLKES